MMILQPKMKIWSWKMALCVTEQTAAGKKKAAAE